MYTGIQLEPTTINMYSGSKPVNVKVWSNVPVFCQTGDDQCAVYVELASSRKDILISCPQRIAFHADTWNVPQTVVIKTKKDEKNRGFIKINVKVLIMASQTTVMNLMWKNHTQTSLAVSYIHIS